MPTPADPFVHEPTEEYIDTRLEEADTQLSHAKDKVLALLCRERIIYTETIQDALNNVELAAFELRCLLNHR